ncbi:hypothetical protein BC829DRAFT_421158 [Chytridium lagenaria]|nr:hypothetical protein BC829DRAFT_421158 [Chytridium lagenaria]
MDGEDEEEFPFRLRLREFSPLVTLSLPTAIEHLRVRVHGVDVDKGVGGWTKIGNVFEGWTWCAGGRCWGVMTRGLTVDEGAAGEGLGVIKEMKVAGEVKKRYLFAVGDDGVLGEREVLGKTTRRGEEVEGEEDKVGGRVESVWDYTRKLGMAASLSSPSENDEDEDDDGRMQRGRGDIGRAFGLDGSLDASEVGGWTAEKIIEIVLGLP